MKKEKIEIKDIKDIALLEKKEQEKWEIALELGLFDQVVQKGWKSLTAQPDAFNRYTYRSFSH